MQDLDDSIVLKDILTLDDVIITTTPKKGWAVATRDGLTVALDLTLTPDLIAEGEEREKFHAERENNKEKFLVE